MVVRAVDVDQPLAELSQHAQGSRRAVDVLAICPGSGERAFQQQLTLLASLQSMLIQQLGHRRLGLSQIEAGLDRTAIAPVANKRSVRSLTQDQGQSAK